ncbi:MAG: RNA polymerase sigma factor [Candidatus Kapabacteria bacterium]|nr:RNA polymerase sigma factor [Candidatus Kapabacteria bacterium]
MNTLTLMYDDHTQPRIATTEASQRQQRFLDALEPVSGRLRRYAEACCKNIHDAEDLVSETILIAYKQFDNIRTDSAFFFYLITIARRLHRKRVWKRRIFGELSDDHEEHYSVYDTPPDVRADISTLYAALDSLPSAMKETVVLFELSGLSLEEIQRIQGGSLSGVKSRLTRGRERLAALLRDNES